MTPAGWCLLAIWAGFALVVLSILAAVGYYAWMRYVRKISAPGPNVATRVFAGILGTGLGFVVFGFVAWLLAVSFSGITA